jgi:hypothetical protein
MKSRNIITVLILLFGFSVISAQEQTKIPDGISIAFKAGNATELAKYMNSTVELLLLDKEDFYKKNVAESILREFFGAQKIEDFNIRHQGARNEAQYAIGTLTTENGDYRVYFLLKKIEGKQLIHQIRIEIEDER